MSVRTPDHTCQATATVEKRYPVVDRHRAIRRGLRRRVIAITYAVGKLESMFTISGFADEIADDIDTQIEVFSELGIDHVD